MSAAALRIPTLPSVGELAPASVVAAAAMFAAAPPLRILRLPLVAELRQEFAEDHVRRAGPHCRQVLSAETRRHFADSDFDLRPLGALPLYFTAESRQIPFVARPDHERSPLHWGQLKLFVSELHFLTGAMERWPEGATVLYAGAAPGHHLPFLASLFPRCRFVLYDPSRFCPAIARGAPGIEAHSSYFAADIAAQFGPPRASPLLFICDIRTGFEEERVESDMAAQKSWVEAMQPDCAMLKFRLPWRAGATPYLDGELLIGTFHPLTSTESRLIVKRDGGMRDYDNVAYERQCAFHNAVGRVYGYAHAVDNVPGLDRCHDCSALVAVAGAWLRASTGAEPTPAAVGEFINAACRAFATGRTIATEYARSSTRGPSGLRHRGGSEPTRE